jgi:hypothetical protein
VLEAHPTHMLLMPQISSERPRPMSLMAGTERRFPVLHKTPPRRARGGVEGKPR